MLLLSGLACIENPQVGHGKGVSEADMDLVAEARGSGTLVVLAATASGASFDSGCSIRVRLLEDSVFLVQLLSCKTHPTIKRGSPFFTAGARLYTHCVGDLLNHITHTYLFFFDETGKANAMRLVFTFTC